MGFMGLQKTYMNYDMYIPFANFFILSLLASPFLLTSRTPLFLLFSACSIFVFYTYDTRIYIFLFFLMYVLSAGKINLRLALAGLAVAGVMIYISSSRAETATSYTNFTFFLNAFGAELRDGLFFHEIFNAGQIAEMRRGWVFNLITVIPGWSYLGIIDGDTLRAMQLPHQLLFELGLDDRGFNGVRTGMLWEAYILFGWSGVIGYSLTSAGAIKICQLLHARGDKFLAGLIAIANCYGIVGYTYFTVSNFSQFILAYFLFFRIIPRVLRSVA
jgi:hypothetical protein